MKYIELKNIKLREYLPFINKYKREMELDKTIDKRIIEQIGLISNIAGYYTREGAPFQDLFQECIISATVALTTYDEKKSKINTYLSACLSHSIIAYLNRNCSRLGNKTYTRAPDSFVECCRISEIGDVQDNFVHPFEIEEQEEQDRILVQKYLNKIKSKKQRYSTEHYYLHGKNFNQIGAEMGVSRSAAQELKKNGLKNIRKKIKKEK